MELEIGKTYSGKEFNERCKEEIFKLTSNTENHNGFQYVTGLNVDTKPFSPMGKCSAGGLYFTTRSFIPEYWQYWMGNVIITMVYARSVTVPDDALVYVERQKYKANKIILGERQLLYHLLSENDKSYYLSKCSSRYIANDDPMLDNVELYDLMKFEASDKTSILARPHPSQRNKQFVMEIITTVGGYGTNLLRYMPSHIFQDAEVLAALDEYNISMSVIPYDAQTKEMWEAVIENKIRWKNSSRHAVPARIWEKLDDKKQLTLLMFVYGYADRYEYIDLDQEFFDRAFAIDSHLVLRMPNDKRMKYLTTSFLKDCIQYKWSDLLTLFPSSMMTPRIMKAAEDAGLRKCRLRNRDVVYRTIKK